jgi:hypothetical protein
MQINESISHITCACGAVFQVIDPVTGDWDEAATAALARTHAPDCPQP